MAGIPSTVRVGTPGVTSQVERGIDNIVPGFGSGAKSTLLVRPPFTRCAGSMGAGCPRARSALATRLPAWRRHSAVAVRSAPSAASYRGRLYHRPSHAALAASSAPAFANQPTTFSRRPGQIPSGRFFRHSTCASMSSLCSFRLRRGGWSSASQSAGDCFKPSRPRFSVHPVMEIRFLLQAAGH